jgi:hypothetical protein
VLLEYFLVAPGDDAGADISHDLGQTALIKCSHTSACQGSPDANRGVLGACDNLCSSLQHNDLLNVCVVRQGHTGHKLARHDIKLFKTV